MLYRYKDSCSAEIKTEAPKVLFYGLFCAITDTSWPPILHRQIFFFNMACFELFGGDYGNLATMDLESERKEFTPSSPTTPQIARAFEDRLYIVRTHYCIWG
jgi:hypothetical protein